MTLDEEYLKLGERLVALNQKRAVLLAKEEEKKRERELLEEQLKQAGVDITKPEAELKRLEDETKAILKKATEQVDVYEKELNKLWPEEAVPVVEVHEPEVQDHDTLELA